ncbi:MAG: glycosyltransferase [Roseiflexaceae bacterium]
MRRLNILTWHIHGSYLNALAQIDHNWYLPIKPDRTDGYNGRGNSSTLPGYVREVPAEHVPKLDLELILFQTPKNNHEDQFEILSDMQRRLPQIYLEHNTPRPHPTDSRHTVADAEVLLVHVTHYNRLMWDNGRAPTIVIEHSVAIDPAIRYSGEHAQGITVINEIQRRGRIAGYDLFLQARQVVPLTIAGMKSAQLGGLGDIHYHDLHHHVAKYRFLFSPMRYTSLPLAVIEAMTIGMPVVALATTELPSVIESGVTGYLSCELDELIARMHELLSNPELARRIGANAREFARARFGIERFAADWNNAFAQAIRRAQAIASERRGVR